MSEPRPEHADDIAVTPQPHHWVERHGDALLRYALLQVRDREVAEDVVQEAIVAALAGRSGFRAESSERTWLISILRHKICDHFRRRAREASLEAGSTPEAGAAQAGAVEAMFTDRGHWRSPPRTLSEASADGQRQELLDRLRHCLGRLDRDLHDAFCLREIHELPTDRICEILEVTPTNLSTRLYRARALLRGCMERHRPEENTPRSR